ncbi:protein SGT1 homolog isoform X1 [Pan troglodytes]|uniref:protein SGT1 homolog isoform X1 n=1 Tax=Pan troglodytes TaxID=9598 RepID=UPI0023F466D6|nr:protein SGT1 homolog isoform X2 [Pan troglodytes]XP_054952796.1 protein SGT1 homolog isoform X1 [Pan paniscus]
MTKFPPWAAVEVVTVIVAAPAAATATTRDGGGCSRNCNIPEVFFQSFSDALIDEDPQAALEELTKALEQKPDDAQYYCQRAYCHILLGNYCVAVADAKKSLELNPNNSTAMLRKGICEYHEKNYAAALETFTEGQKLDKTGFHRVGQAGLQLLTSSDPPALDSQSAGITGADANFSVWIKRCQEAQNGSESEVWTHQSKIKYDWYQTESQVVITLMIKNVQKNDVNVEFSEKELSALVKLPSGEDYNLKLELLHPIIPEQSTFKVLSTKIEIKLKKPEAVRWEKLEGQGDVPTPKQFVADVKNLYPSSSPYTRNWDKLVGEIKEEEKNEKLEGDAALNRLFQQIYSDGSDEVKRAMNKSFMESGGTVLSTNWSDVGKRKVEINPPDDMEWKKY